MEGHTHTFHPVRNSTTRTTADSLLHPTRLFKGAAEEKPLLSTVASVTLKTERTPDGVGSTPVLGRGGGQLRQQFRRPAGRGAFPPRSRPVAPETLLIVPYSAAIDTT